MPRRQPLVPSNRPAGTPIVQDGPTVLDIISSLESPRGSLLEAIRDAALALEGAEERTVYDGFCREWTPAYYLGKRQLFHVHDFRGGLRATMFIGVRTLQPVILDSDQVSPEIRDHVAETSAGRGTKQVKFPLESMDDVEAFMHLVRVKWAALSGVTGPPARG